MAKTIQSFHMTGRMFGPEGSSSWERGARSPSKAHAVRERALLWLDDMLDTYGEKDARVLELMEFLSDWSDAWEPPIDPSVEIPEGHSHMRMTLTEQVDTCQTIAAGSTISFRWTPLRTFKPYALFIPRSIAHLFSVSIEAIRQRYDSDTPGEMFSRPGGRRIHLPTLYPSTGFVLIVRNLSLAAARFDAVVDGYTPHSSCLP